MFFRVKDDDEEEEYDYFELVESSLLHKRFQRPG
jgi:hypothetical protein